MTTSIRVDGEGLYVPEAVDDSCDVLFDDRHVWSFSLDDRPREEDGTAFVPWPRLMRPWLEGHTRVRVTHRGKEIFGARVDFTDDDKAVDFRDKFGIPIMIDKWGLIQRPFTGRDPAVVEQMVERTDEILRVLREECGIHAWMAFGTLLGAAREGKVIGHDSDIDVAFLSASEIPSVVAGEMYAAARALRRAGMKVVNKSASFITVLFEVADGATGSIDVYSCFYVGDLLHETATVRAPVSRSAIEPLGTMRFEGRELPAPADPATVLAASYGEGWRVPDPSFQHRPGRDITDRFDDWFGSLMRQRRDWERFHRDASRTKSPSGFGSWVAGRLTPGTHVVDVGAGAGSDALYFAKQGFQVTALDYARGSLGEPARRAREADLPARFAQLNLLDLRDVLSMAAVVARESAGPRVLYARGLLDALDEEGTENFWRFADVVLRGGGTAYLEVGVSPRSKARGVPTGRLRRIAPDVVEHRAELAGGRVLRREDLPADRRMPGGAPAPHWRMAVEWTR
ncbi:MAG: methyltransferase domain-containing protein [Nocardioidaceae bacterium]